MTEQGTSQYNVTSTVQGVFWIGLSGLLLVAMTGVIRSIGSGINPIQASFLRYAFGVLLVIPIFFRMEIKTFRSTRILFLAGRGAIHGIAVMLWFFSMTRIPVAEVAALGFTSSIFIIIGAAIFLNERLYPRRLLAVMAGMMGAIAILRPGIQVIDVGAIVMLAAAFLFSSSLLMAKHLTKTETNATIIAFLSLFAALALLPFALAVWETPTLWELFWLLITALLATFAHYAMNRAFQLADITVLQPFMFLQLIWATLLGFLMFNEQPDLWVWIGGAIIISTATYIAKQESRAKIL